MFSKELFGQRIFELRTKHNETQKALGLLLDVGKGHISEIERGRKSPSLEQFFRICEALKIQIRFEEAE